MTKIVAVVAATLAFMAPFINAASPSDTGVNDAVSPVPTYIPVAGPAFNQSSLSPRADSMAQHAHIYGTCTVDDQICHLADGEEISCPYWHILYKCREDGHRCRIRKRDAGNQDKMIAHVKCGCMRYRETHCNPGGPD